MRNLLQASRSASVTTGSPSPAGIAIVMSDGSTLLTPPAGARGADPSFGPCIALLTLIAARFSSASASFTFWARTASIRPSSVSATKWPGFFRVTTIPVVPDEGLKVPTAITLSFAPVGPRSRPTGRAMHGLGPADLPQGSSCQGFGAGLPQLDGAPAVGAPTGGPGALRQWCRTRNDPN